MNSKCFFCDTELASVKHTFKVGPKDEPVCDECHVKTVNRKRAKEGESGSR